MQIPFRGYIVMLFTLICGSLSIAQAPEQVRVVKDLAYRTGPDLSAYEQERCKLDLHLPVGRANFPVIVWFYGGGLESGYKENAETLGVATRFARDGVAVAVPNYRHSPKVAFPAFIDDAAASVAWVKAHIAEYGGNPNALIISGHSAGGYLAAFLGVQPDYLAKYGVKLTDIAGIIPVSGQTFTHTTIRKACGIADPRATPLLDEAAPCYYARKDAPPILAIFGDHDMPMRAEENRFFIAMLKTVGHTRAEYLEIADRTHSTIVGKIPETDDPVAKAILGFVTKYTKP